MKPATINPAFQFIQTVGVPGLVSGVQTGMVPPAQALTAFHAIGSAIDTYVEAAPEGTVLNGLRSAIGGLATQGNIATEAQDEILGLLTTHWEDVELAVRMAITGGAAVANIEASYDLGAEWKWIPPGEFQMGSRSNDEHAYGEEKPLRTVVTGGFFMLDHPVTNGEFRAFLKATRRKDVRKLDKALAGDDQPAVRVTREEATAYSNWLGREMMKRTGYNVFGRLPTEAEWEKAAKGPHGNEFIAPATPQQAHFNASATREVTHPDAYANGYGLKDMIGNVWELTSSSRGGSSGLARVRGGSYSLNYPHGLRAACHLDVPPGDRCGYIGFRPLFEVFALSTDLNKAIASTISASSRQKEWGYL